MSQFSALDRVSFMSSSTYANIVLCFSYESSFSKTQLAYVINNCSMCSLLHIYIYICTYIYHLHNMNMHLTKPNIKIALWST